MSTKRAKEFGPAYAASVTDLNRPIILRLQSQRARRAADRAVFGDLVGCALSSGEPEWVPTPGPHWRIPYTGFDGKLLITVDVEADTLAVSLTDKERSALLERVEQQVSAGNVSS